MATKKKGSRLAEAVRKRAMSYPETHADFPPIDEGFRAVAPKRVVATLPEPPELP